MHNTTIYYVSWILFDEAGQIQLNPLKIVRSLFSGVNTSQCICMFHYRNFDDGTHGIAPVALIIPAEEMQALLWLIPVHLTLIRTGLYCFYIIFVSMDYRSKQPSLAIQF